jgi:hypothetical protein
VHEIGPPFRFLSHEEWVGYTRKGEGGERESKESKEQVERGAGRGKSPDPATSSSFHVGPTGPIDDDGGIPTHPLLWRATCAPTSQATGAPRSAEWHGLMEWRVIRAL